MRSKVLHGNEAGCLTILKQPVNPEEEENPEASSERGIDDDLSRGSSLGDSPESVSSSPIQFNEARKVLPTAKRAKLATTLRYLANEIEKDNLQAGHPYAVAVVLLTDDVPIVTTQGLVEWDDFRHIQWALDAKEDAMRKLAKGDEDLDHHEFVAEHHRKRLSQIQAHEDEKQTHRTEHPWSCEFCKNRFKTERGAKTHEARCWQNPSARQYGDEGTYVPLQVKDGVAHGYMSKECAKREGRL